MPLGCSRSPSESLVVRRCVVLRNIRRRRSASRHKDSAAFASELQRIFARRRRTQHHHAFLSIRQLPNLFERHSCQHNRSSMDARRSGQRERARRFLPVSRIDANQSFFTRLLSQINRRIGTKKQECEWAFRVEAVLRLKDKLLAGADQYPWACTRECQIDKSIQNSCGVKTEHPSAWARLMCFSLLSYIVLVLLYAGGSDQSRVEHSLGSLCSLEGRCANSELGDSNILNTSAAVLFGKCACQCTVANFAKETTLEIRAELNGLLQEKPKSVSGPSRSWLQLSSIYWRDKTDETFAAQIFRICNFLKSCSECHYGWFNALCETINIAKE